MPVSLTLTVAAQSLTRSSDMPTADALQLLRDGAAHHAPDIDLDDPVAVANWWLDRWVGDLRRSARDARRAVVARQVPEPEDLQ